MKKNLGKAGNVSKILVSMSDNTLTMQFKALILIHIFK